jgi:hypothetical protein
MFSKHFILGLSGGHVCLSMQSLRSGAFGFGWAFGTNRASGAVAAQRISGLTVGEGLQMSGEDLCRRDGTGAASQTPFPLSCWNSWRTKVGL